jgi:hypothetical protein
MRFDVPALPVRLAKGHNLGTVELAHPTAQIRTLVTCPAFHGMVPEGGAGHARSWILGKFAPRGVDDDLQRAV